MFGDSHGHVFHGGHHRRTQQLPDETEGHAALDVCLPVCLFVCWSFGADATSQGMAQDSVAARDGATHIQVQVIDTDTGHRHRYRS